VEINNLHSNCEAQRVQEEGQFSTQLYDYYKSLGNVGSLASSDNLTAVGNIVGNYRPVNENPIIEDILRVITEWYVDSKQKGTADNVESVD